VQPRFWLLSLPAVKVRPGCWPAAPARTAARVQGTCSVRSTPGHEGLGDPGWLDTRLGFACGQYAALGERLRAAAGARLLKLEGADHACSVRARWQHPAPLGEPVSCPHSWPTGVTSDGRGGLQLIGCGPVHFWSRRAGVSCADHAARVRLMSRVVPACRMRCRRVGLVE
jgi:hypothetical protein